MVLVEAETVLGAAAEAENAVKVVEVLEVEA